MIKPMIGIVLLLMVVAMYIFGQQAMIGILGAVVGFFIAEGVDWAVREEARRHRVAMSAPVQDADEDDRGRGRR